MNSVYGVRSIHPKSICNFLSLKKGISMERQCLHISNPRFTKITSWRNMFTILYSVVRHRAN